MKCLGPLDPRGAAGGCPGSARLGSARRGTGPDSPGLERRVVPAPAGRGGRAGWSALAASLFPAVLSRASPRGASHARVGVGGVQASALPWPCRHAHLPAPPYQAQAWRRDLAGAQGPRRTLRLGSGAPLTAWGEAA